MKLYWKRCRLCGEETFTKKSPSDTEDDELDFCSICGQDMRQEQLMDEEMMDVVKEKLDLRKKSKKK